MPSIPKTFIQDLLNQINLIDLIEKRIRLKKVGSRFTAKCPFHQEKTASFYVEPQKQFYYCFGCHAHGNAISFLMEYDRLSFVEAIETLATSLGLSIPSDPKESSLSKKQIQRYEFIEKISRFYQKQLAQSNRAKQYLKQRGISEKTQKHFQLGFAPNQWDTLTQKITQKPELSKILQETGMICKKDNTAHFYDRFRNRLIFPIKNAQGKTIAFGGRSLDNQQIPKYLNSPETPLFQKGSELYGLSLLKRPEKILVVEGYMDVIALYEHGIDFALAPLGTAITKQQIQLLTRYTCEIVFCFDGDEAGQKAAWKALEILCPMMKDGLYAHFLTLANGEDPDSLLQSKGKTAFEQILKKAIPLEDFFFNTLSQPFNLETIHGKTQLAESAKPYLNTLPNGLFKQLMIEKLAKLTEVSIEQLNVSSPKYSIALSQEKWSQKKNKRKAPSAMRTVIRLLLQNPYLVEHLSDLQLLNSISLPGTHLLKELIQIIQSDPHISTAILLEHFREKPQEQKQLAQLALEEHIIPKEGLKEEFLGAIRCIQQQGMQKTINELLERSKTKALSQEEKNMLQVLIKHKVLKDLN
jgi:DNA primase